VTTLDPQDYWQLRAMHADLERDQATLAAVQARLAASQAKRQEMWRQVVEKYALDPNAQYQLKDDDCSITPASTGNGQP